MNPAELLVPAVRWDADHGFVGQRELIEAALDLGVGGFIIFGGPADQVREFVRELQQRSRTPLLIGADLERGAGQQFPGCTGLPPLAALGWLGDADVMRAAGYLTATEARALGINWVYAPVLDLDVEPENPIVGTRAIGADATAVAALGRAWIEGCQSQRVMACGKHFPGHGRTTTDSHAELPAVVASRHDLEQEDLRPFQDAVDGGVASMMSAHVTYPALDPSGLPATLSSAILRGVLRGRFRFDGLIVTDALIMAGVLQDATEEEASVRALAAGCDILLYPSDIGAVSRAIAEAVARGDLAADELRRSGGRRREWVTWATGDAPATSGGGVAYTASPAWARDVACRVVHLLRGEPAALRGSVHVTVVDDDVGGPYPPPSRQPFTDRLRALGVEVRETQAADQAAAADDQHVVALFGDIRAWKGRPGYSAAALEQVRTATRARGATVVQFSHPRLAHALEGEYPVVCAWGGEPAMQMAAADWLVNRCGGD